MITNPVLSNIELWEKYKALGTQEARNNLVVAYMGLVQNVSHKMYTTLGGAVEMDDLISYGTFGLMESIRRFDPERGITFEHFAAQRVRGAIVDELRTLDLLPRTVRAKARGVSLATALLESDLQRSPTDVEVGIAVGMTAAEVRHSQVDAASGDLLSLENVVVGQRTVSEVLPDRAGAIPLHMCEVREIKRDLADAIERLSHQEQVVLALYYYQGLTLTRIADLLGMTENWVGQIHSRAMRRAGGEGL